MSFNRDSRFSGPKKFGTKNFGGRNFGGGNRGFGNRNSGRPMTMHQATCSKCGKDCEVPFRPTGERPVFCSDCFKNEGGNMGRSEGRNFGRSSFDKQMHEATCDKCGNKCEVPFKPTGGKPIFCSQCFEKNGNGNVGNRNTDQFKAQFDMLNSKLDKILKALSPAVALEATQEDGVEKEKKEVKKSKINLAKPKAGTKKVTAKKKK